MNDMSGTIIAKSDQMNAADMVGISFIGAIREVRIKADKGDDQPVDILFDGQKKAFRPCKGVRRLLVKAWGPDANNYIGKTLELFCDPSVTWAGKEEGGIRVSRMSHIERAFTFAMRISRAATKPYKIEPLVIEQPRQQSNDQDGALVWANGFIHLLGQKNNLPQLNEFASSKAKKLDELGLARPELHERCIAALADRRAELSPNDGTFDPDDNPTAVEGPDDSQRGDQFTDADDD